MFKRLVCRFGDCISIRASFNVRGYVINTYPACHRNIKSVTILQVPIKCEMYFKRAYDEFSGLIPQAEGNVISADEQVSAAVTEYAEVIPLSSGLLRSLLLSLCEFGFSVDDGIVMVKKCPVIAERSKGQILEMVMAFRQCSFVEVDILSILRSSPEHLLVEPSIIVSRYKTLRKYFSHKSLKYIFSNCPRIGFSKWSVIQEKLDYLGNTMKIPTHQIAQSRSLDCPLIVIKARLMFLERAGVFKMSDPKSRVTNKNPTLRDIIDSDDEYFAMKIACITAEEYYVFQELISLEDSKKDDDDLEND